MSTQYNPQLIHRETEAGMLANFFKDRVNIKAEKRTQNCLNTVSEQSPLTRHVLHPHHLLGKPPSIPQLSHLLSGTSNCLASKPHAQY